MWKYFVFNLYLALVAWQVLCEAPAGNGIDGEDDAVSQDFNDTDSYFVPQPRRLQVRSSGGSYTLNFMPVNWHTARELCAAQNQVLASVQSLQERAGIIVALGQYGIFQSENTFWIGGSQLGHIGQWHWVSTGQPVYLSHWRTYPQADNFCNRNCMEIYVNGQWNNNDCDLRRPFICEDLPACN